MPADDTLDLCPQCGQPTAELPDGVCQDCAEDNHHQLLLHILRAERWAKLTPAQREAEIRWAHN